MRIFYTAVDNGDGSLGVEFFDCQEAIDLLEEHDFERYRGEGGGYFDTFGGISAPRKTLADARKYLIESLGISEDFLDVSR